jgi:hypothetical protein
MRLLPQVSRPTLGPRTETEPTRRAEQDLQFRVIDEGLLDSTLLGLVCYDIRARSLPLVEPREETHFIVYIL